MTRLVYVAALVSCAGASAAAYLGDRGPLLWACVTVAGLAAVYVLVTDPDLSR